MLQEIARGIILGFSSSPPSYSHTNKGLAAKQRGPACCREQTTAEMGDNLQHQTMAVPLARASTESAQLLVVLPISINFQEPTSLCETAACKVTPSGCSWAVLRELPQSTAPKPVLLMELSSRGFLTETPLVIYNTLYRGWRC